MVDSTPDVLFYSKPSHSVNRISQTAWLLRNQPVNENRISQTDGPMTANSRKDGTRYFNKNLCKVKQFGRMQIDPLPGDLNDISSEVKKPVKLSLRVSQTYWNTHTHKCIYLCIRIYINY